MFIFYLSVYVIFQLQFYLLVCNELGIVCSVHVQKMCVFSQENILFKGAFSIRSRVHSKYLIMEAQFRAR